MLPYDPGFATLGARPTLPLFDVYPGFDWTAGKVMLDFGQLLSVRDDDLHRRLSRQESALGKVLLLTQKLGESDLFPMEKQVAEFKEDVEFVVRSGLSNPTKDKKPVKPKT